jgi:hypothetical protein
MYEEHDERFVCSNSRYVRSYEKERFWSGAKKALKGGEVEVMFSRTGGGSHRACDCGFDPQSTEGGGYPPSYFPARADAQKVGR